ncbi:MAG: V-type ATP synthase subunit E family protein [Chitinivibrionales bacterium]
MNENSEKLLQGLERDTEEKVKGILESAEKKASDKRADADRRYNHIIEKSKDRAEILSREISNKADSNLRIEIKRKRLRFRDTLLKQVISMVEERFLNTGPKRMYEILLDWTVEAGSALGNREASLSVSERYRELIDRNFISKAEEGIKASSELSVSLTLSNESLSEPGIILTSSDRRTAFNNTLSTRIKRMEKEIRNTVYTSLLNNEDSIDKPK